MAQHFQDLVDALNAIFPNLANVGNGDHAQIIIFMSLKGNLTEANRNELKSDYDISDNDLLDIGNKYVNGTTGSPCN
jgi:hypothetical protein